MSKADGSVVPFPRFSQPASIDPSKRTFSLISCDLFAKFLSTLEKADEARLDAQRTACKIKLNLRSTILDLLTHEARLEADIQRLYDQAVMKMARASQSYVKQKDALLQDAVKLFDKATKASIAARECRQQIEFSRIALASRNEQLVTALDAFADTVCHGVREALGTLTSSSTLAMANQEAGSGPPYMGGANAHMGNTIPGPH